MGLVGAAKTWEANGFVVLPDYLPSEELGAAVRELPSLFPTGDEFHDSVDPPETPGSSVMSSTASTASPSPAAH